MDKARVYNEQFARVLPLDWEMAVVSRLLGPLKTVLDVGCGTGRHVIPLAEKGLSVAGIDRDKEYVKRARDKLESEKLLDAADLLVADAQHLPWVQSSFDGVICMGNVLGDVAVRRDERVAIVEEMIRAGGSDAVFIVEFVHRYWKPVDLLVWVLRYLVTSLRKMLGEPVEYGDYSETIRFDHDSERLSFHAFTIREAEDLFAKQGLSVGVEKRGRFFHNWFIVVARRNHSHREVP